MYVLGIESTCDETACAVVKDGKEILSNVIASQHDIHSLYGGVFPELACRRHVDVILPTVQKALQDAGLSASDIDLISVAKGPGLIGALTIGLNFAKGLSMSWKKPFVGVNHVEAHLYGAMMANQSYLFPAIGAVISGGHTFLVKINSIGSYEKIGSTVDDAIGEAFDKVASMLGLPYPGGPKLEKLASNVSSSPHSFSQAKVKGRPWDFSFSGLKTNVLYTIDGRSLTEKEKAEIAYSFQETACKEIVRKTVLAAKEWNVKAIYLGGGVSNNIFLREMFTKQELQVPVFWPSRDLSLDNGAMIAGLGYHVFQKDGPHLLSVEPMTRIPLC